MGLHNWIQFYLQEKHNHVDYKGYKARDNKDTVRNPQTGPKTLNTRLKGKYINRLVNDPLFFSWMFHSRMKTTTSWTYSSAGRAWWSPSVAPSSASVQSLRWLFSPSSSSCRLRRWHQWWSKYTSTCWSWSSTGTGGPSAPPSPNCSAATTEICREASCHDGCLRSCNHNPEFWNRLALNGIIRQSIMRKVWSQKLLICNNIIDGMYCCYFVFSIFWILLWEDKLCNWFKRTCMFSYFLCCLSVFHTQTHLLWLIRKNKSITFLQNKLLRSVFIRGDSGWHADGFI